MEEFFQLKENKTNVRTEIIAGLTTFFAMAYVIFVNPSILENTGMDYYGVFVATIIVAVAGTLIMAFVANVPYALAPGMGLNAFFTYTVCGTMGFSWETALAMVMLCGFVNIIITVTGFRRVIIEAMPRLLQNAIGGGIGLFIAYIGIKDCGLLQFSMDPKTFTIFGSGADVAASGVVGVAGVANSAAIPALVNFSSPAVQLALIGIVVILILVALNVKGGILIGIIATTLIGIPMGVTNVSNIHFDLGVIGNIQYTAFKFDFAHLFSVVNKAADGSVTYGAFSVTRMLIAFSAMLGFILTDIFDCLGTLIGTGRKTGIFGDIDEAALHGSKKLNRAFFSDMVATVTGAFVGTSNSTTYVESSTGIAAGGRTGLTSVVTAIMFALCLLLSPIVGIVPAQATAPALVVVGILMASSFAEINWADFDIAATAFLTAAIMPFSYSITTGIAFGFITYVILKLMRGKVKDVHPVMYLFTVLFILNFLFQAVNKI